MYFSVYAHGAKQHYGSDFVSEFRTTTSPQTITIPFINTSTYNCTIDWADGTANSAITAYNDADRAHEFATAGTYVIRIRGAMRGIGFNNGGDKANIYDVKQWGRTNQISWASGFYGCTNMTVTAQDDACNDGTATTLSNMFRALTTFNAPLKGWNTAAVTDMSYMFNSATVFNQDIGAWNTAAVTDMSYMFRDATAFNQDIGAWNTAKVTNIAEMFRSTPSFNQDIGAWNTAAVTNMSSMFRDATKFNQDIGAWNTAKVTNMMYIFYGATAFNQDIGSWNVAKVPDMEYMFRLATAFNQDLSAWDMSDVAGMGGMWGGAIAMNQANVDNFLLALYTQRMNFTWATPSVSLTSCAAPSGTYQDATPPTTGNEYRYKLVENPDSEARPVWTITVAS